MKETKAIPPAQGQSPQNQVVDPQAIEKQAIRLLLQVQQAVTMLSDIIDALRKEIISRDEAEATKAAIQKGAE